MDPTGRATYLLDFGPVPVGSTAIRAIALQNVGSAALELSTHSPSAPFSLGIPPGPLTIEVGESRELSFAFAPTEASERPDQVIVTFSTNEPNAGEGGARTHTIRLVGEGVAPRLDCDTELVDFGQVIKGDSRKRTVSCKNDLAAPLVLKIEGFRGNARASFSAVVPGKPLEDPVAIAPGESVELELTFKADSVGKNDASLFLRDENAQLLAQIGVVGETMTSALQISPTTCLTFDYVAVGDSKTLALQARNIGTQPLRIVGFQRTAEESRHFDVRTAAPIELPAEPETLHEISVEFHPEVGGELSAQIEILAEEVGGSPTPIKAVACVTGFGGGPKLACHPSSIDFGMVAVGIPMSRSFTCLNDGYEPPGVTIDPLVVSGLSSDNPNFTATIRNPDGSSGPKAQGYKVGEEFGVEVVFGPKAEGFDTGGISVASEAADGGALRVAVAGEGRLLPPCEFSIIPPQLRFGVVDRGKELELHFGIKNHLETACLIHDLRLSGDSHPAYSVDPIASYELAGGETLVVPVTFAPTEYAPSITGKVQFQISHPTLRDQVVPLQGISAEACLLVEPTVLDFGKAEPGCTSREQVVTVTNVCRKLLTIKDVKVSEAVGSEQFSIKRRPILPKDLEQRDRDEIHLTFTPDSLGKHAGAIEIEVEDRSAGVTQSYLARLHAEGSDNAVQTDHFQQKPQPKVDILWVMDNSGSFELYQERVSENLPAFLSYANKNGIDWQIAVTTTGLTSHYEPMFPCPGGVDGGENGRFFPVDGSHPRILDRRTQDIDVHWRHNMLVGVCHWDEQPLEAGKRALSEPLISSVKDERYPNSGFQDGNAGFLRPDADLSVIFVTDEVDHSPDTIAGYLNFFRSVKGPRSNNRLKIHAITGPKEAEGWKGCQFVEYGDRVHALIEATEGTWLNICTPTDDKEQWSKGLEKMSEGAFGFVTRFVLRGLPASKTGGQRVTEKDIELRINGTVRPPTAGVNQVWTYDPVANAIDFTHFYTPPAGAQITATYNVKCLGN